MSKPIHVLLVEDNPADADLTRETLESSKLRLSVAVVTDGAQAVDFLHKRESFVDAPEPDLVILDLNLPKMDGREVLEEIKLDPRLRRIPVVILTSSDAEQDIARSYDLGANCYVTKPLDLQAFQSIVHSVTDFWFTVVRLPPTEPGW
jgi:CheY-like chemotaxis protein